MVQHVFYAMLQEICLTWLQKIVQVAHYFPNSIKQLINVHQLIMIIWPLKMQLDWLMLDNQLLIGTMSMVKYWRKMPLLKIALKQNLTIMELCALHAAQMNTSISVQENVKLVKHLLSMIKIKEIVLIKVKDNIQFHRAPYNLVQLYSPIKKSF